MKLKLVLAACLAALTAPALAQAPAARPAPRLVVAISMDQFSADLFAQYRQHFTGGLRRLAQGAVFPSGYQAHAATETCPGHSTILTGSRPARTGIIANNWFDLGTAREDKGIYCAEDESVPGSSSSSYTVSPVHLRVPAMGDWMIRADPRSRVVAVAGKDRAAIMMGGHRPTARWWWGGNAFVSHAGVEAPAAVARVNAAVTQALAAPRAASPASPICAPRSRPVPVVGSSTPVGAGRFARDAGNRNAFRASPDFDQAVLDIAAGLRRDMRLGQGPAPDLLAIGLSATDYVGHSAGTQGSEMCEHLLAVDAALGRFLAELDSSGVDYVVMLTADHGGLDIPERSREEGELAASRIDPALNAENMSTALGQQLGLSGRVLYGDGGFGDMYVSRDLSEADRARALEAALQAYRRHPQVAAVFTRDEILAAPRPRGNPEQWSLIERARESVDAGRSGDFVVLLQPWVTPIYITNRGYVATHGSPWNYDRRVPILFYRRGMTSFEQPLPVETIDILPTLAPLIGLAIDPASIDGKCLDLIAGPANSCTPVPAGELG